uniref:Uncharacterized protein n=1 Tax=Amblyomma parvum TaxID=251391 RepID=A0A023FZZ1_AMBPA
MVHCSICLLFNTVVSYFFLLDAAYTERFVFSVIDLIGELCVHLTVSAHLTIPTDAFTYQGCGFLYLWWLWSYYCTAFYRGHMGNLE